MTAGPTSVARGSPLDFFIAYASPDRATADRLYELLVRESTVFLDHRSLQLGDDWDRELRNAQQRAHVTVVLVSEHTDEGFYQREEIAAAIEMARGGSHRVVPIWLMKGQTRRPGVPYGLRVKHGIEVHASSELDGTAQLLLGMRRGGSSPVGLRTPVATPTGRQRAADTVSRGPLTIVSHPELHWAIRLEGYIVADLAFSRDGRRLATATMQKSAQVWDVITGQERLRVTHRALFSKLRGVAFNPDGRRLATTSSDKSARIWDAATGKELVRLRHPDEVMQVAFSPDGRRLATVCADGATRIWDATTGGLLADFIGASVAFSPDGSRLATGVRSNNKSARIWDAATGKELVKCREADAIHAVAFSPDGNRLAGASSDELARIWDAKTGEELVTIEHANAISIAFSSDGRWLAAGGSYKSDKQSQVGIWDARTGQELVTIQHTEATIVACSPDGRWLGTGSSRSFGEGKEPPLVKIWDLAQSSS